MKQIVDSPVRLSNSRLWEITENYFKIMGAEAWKADVPYFISSNAFVGHSYAKLVINFIKDSRALDPEFKNKICYMMETGSGTGCFSFYFLKSFKALLKQYQLEDQKFNYIITDISEKNLTFCKENPSLKPFIEAGELDFAHFNMAKDSDFYLDLKKITYSELKSTTPLIVIANYTLDCLKQDLFQYKKNELNEILVSLNSNGIYDLRSEKSRNSLKIDFKEKACDAAVEYEDKKINEFFQEYHAQFKKEKTIFSFPIDSLHFINNLAKLTQNKFLLIAGDVGYTSIEEMHDIKLDDFALLYGVFFLQVNFHALVKYVKKMQGDVLLSSYKRNFSVNLLSIGCHLSDYVEASAYYKDVIDVQGPEEVFNLSSYSGRNLTHYLTSLRLLHWDPFMYFHLHEAILKLMPIKSKRILDDFKQDLDKVRENIYPYSHGPNIYKLLAEMYFANHFYNEAIALYQNSLVTFGESADVYAKLAKIYEIKKDPSSAALYAKKMRELSTTTANINNRVKKIMGLRGVNIFLKGIAAVGIMKLLLFFMGWAAAH